MSESVRLSHLGAFLEEGLAGARRDFRSFGIVDHGTALLTDQGRRAVEGLAFVAEAFWDDLRFEAALTSPAA
jgi:hypothetical protein